MKVIASSALFRRFVFFRLDMFLEVLPQSVSHCTHRFDCVYAPPNRNETKKRLLPKLANRVWSSSAMFTGRGRLRRHLISFPSMGYNYCSVPKMGTFLLQFISRSLVWNADHLQKAFD